MIEIRDKLAHYLMPSYLHQSNSENSQNIFFAIIRFNVILLNFVLITEILTRTTAKTFILQAASDILKAILIVISRCEEEKDRGQGQYDSQFQRIRKFEIQLRWIKFHLETIQKKIVHAPRGENNFMDWPIFKKVYFFESIEKEKDRGRESQFEELLQQQITLRRERKISVWRISEGIKMFELVRLSLFLIQSRFNCFIFVAKRVLQPLEVLQFLTSLVSEYHINHKELLVETIQIAKQITTFYFTHPQQIKQWTDTQNIINAASAIRISKIKDEKYTCSLCGVISGLKICYHCNQNCPEFLYPKDMPVNIEDYWNEYLNLYDFFINNEINRVPHQFREELTFKLFTATFS